MYQTQPFAQIQFPCDMNVFEQHESSVRSYSRKFRALFSSASGAMIYDNDGQPYLDFFSGAGALNYGHNNKQLKSSLIDYISKDGITHSLDMATTSKQDFLVEFVETILRPRNLDYKIQFTGPTGANAVEAAMKIARKATGRSNIIAFTNGFHGVSAGALSATANSYYRTIPGNWGDTNFLPFDGYHGQIDTIDLIERYLADSASGYDVPAAFIVETIQAEGGINVASDAWLKKLSKLANRLGILLIVDDIQVGCGRTGTFFSFEDSGIVPDIVVLSKSLSGYGLPFSVVLTQAKYDVWKPGEHNGTFRGNNLAFVTAREALRCYWRDGELTAKVALHSSTLSTALQKIVDELRRSGLANATLKGRGLILGIDFGLAQAGDDVSRIAFDAGLIVESCGAKNNVLKCLPPLTIDDNELNSGIGILTSSITEYLSNRPL